MKAYLIDPIRKLVVPLEYNGEAAEVVKIYNDYQHEKTTTVRTEQINKQGDFVTHNSALARPEDAAYCWNYYCASCDSPHCFVGAAIVTGSIREDKDSLEDPMFSIRAYKEMVQWGYVEEKRPTTSPWDEVPRTFMGTVDEFLEWLEGSDGKSVQ